MKTWPRPVFERVERCLSTFNALSRKPVSRRSLPPNDGETRVQILREWRALKPRRTWIIPPFSAWWWDTLTYKRLGGARYRQLRREGKI